MNYSQLFRIMNQTDHHFSKKLRDLEIAPSERANELFRARLEQLSPQKGKPWKYFATAAAVLVALGFLFLLHLDKSVMNTDTALVLPEPAEQTTAAATEEEPVTTEEPAATEEASSRPATPVSEPAPTPVIKALKNIAASQNVTGSSPVAEPLPRKNLSDLQSLNPEISYRYHSPDLTDFAILDAHNRLELDVRETSSKEVTETPIPLLAKVVREVKYVANGEKPDLDRSGIKPAATVLAHNQNGLLANESRQIKEGFNRFKEMFK